MIGAGDSYGDIICSVQGGWIEGHPRKAWEECPERRCFLIGRLMGNSYDRMSFMQDPEGRHIEDGLMR